MRSDTVTKGKTAGTTSFPFNALGMTQERDGQTISWYRKFL